MLHRISEDPKLRAFLSSHFDTDAYVNLVINDGRTDESFKEVSNCLDEVNEEIKGYISDNKESLMSGMQDVASLAAQYIDLSATSQKLHRSVDRLKNEAFESHKLVQARTLELERIHSVGITLRQLRQFAHAKAQLDHHLRATKTEISSDAGAANKLDVRFLAAASKTLHELETLLGVPNLVEIDFVADHTWAIRSFGQQLRQQAQEFLFSALKERNQAAIAVSLQIFYNLQSLPEVIVLAIDNTVKQAVDLSRGAIDLDALADTYAELKSATAQSASSSDLSKRAAGTDVSAAASTVVSPQLRAVLQEAAHVWAGVLHEQAMQVRVLQRVVMRKEDPVSHQKFVDVLQQRDPAFSSSFVGSSGGGHGNVPYDSNNKATWLANGCLLDMFWDRLAVGLQDVAQEKVRTQPTAALSMYPHMRKAATEVFNHVEDLSKKDFAVTDGRAESATSTANLTYVVRGAGVGVDSARVDSDEIFGTGAWTQSFPHGTTGLLSALGVGVGYSTTGGTGRYNCMGHAGNRARTLSPSTNPRRGGAVQAEVALMAGLSPICNRYLAAALARMNSPVLQMFPELEGYTAAVPSKRDLQALMRAIQAELLVAALDGDIGIVRAVCKESVKSLQLLLTKAESLASAGADAVKISPVGQSFSRCGAQEHNAQLVSLLAHLREALEKLPVQVEKAFKESAGAEGGESSSGLKNVTVPGDAMLAAALGEVLRPEDVRKEIATVSQAAWGYIDDLALRQFLLPLVDSLTDYTKRLVLPLLRESVQGAAPMSPAAGKAMRAGTSSTRKGGDNEALMSVDCSKTVQALLKQVPELVKIYLQNPFPRCAFVLAAMEEYSLRVLSMYVTVASLQRPVTELSRLRTAKEMSSLEQILTSLYPISDPHNCSVLQEFRAFRHLLFMEEVFPPPLASVLALPHASALRPSTLLGYLACCAPSQLPAPHETAATNRSSSGDGGNNSGASEYLDSLMLCGAAADTSAAPGAGNITSRLVRLSQAEGAISPMPGGATITVPGSVTSLYRTSQLQTHGGLKGEQVCWRRVQLSLDVFAQRINVADAATRVHMKAWYKTLLETGSYYFGKL